MSDTPIQEYHTSVHGKTHTSACRIITYLQAEVKRLEKGLSNIAISEFDSVEDLRWEAKKALKGERK